MERVDTVILGAGAAGMMCAVHAGARGGRVLVVDHAKSPGEKIRISGGGRCNFTNLNTTPDHFLSANPHFCKSALGRYSPWDFVDLVGRHAIPWHEKTDGQLFCDRSAKDIIAMLLDEMASVGATLRLRTDIEQIEHGDGMFRLRLSSGWVAARHLVIATGGKSIPKMGATGFGYRVAEQFGLVVTETRPALVPYTFGPEALAWIKPLAGIAADATVTAGAGRFAEPILFTHRGISGPGALQTSSFWREGAPIRIALAAPERMAEALRAARAADGRRQVATVLADVMPKRLAGHMAGELGADGPVAGLSDKAIAALAEGLADWVLKPTGTEGYRTAEVTLGGIDTNGLDARTMAARGVPGLYFIGECVDVTGWLGGYNFQWAWASGWAAGQAIAEAAA